MDNAVDIELLAALVAFAGAQRNEFFEAIIIGEVKARGSSLCACGCDLRSHVLRVLKKGGELEHRFTELSGGGLS